MTIPVLFVSLVVTLLTYLGKKFIQNLHITSYTVLVCFYLNSVEGSINYDSIRNLYLSQASSLSISPKLLSDAIMHTGGLFLVIRDFQLYDSSCSVHLDIPMNFLVVSVMHMQAYCTADVEHI